MLASAASAPATIPAPQQATGTMHIGAIVVAPEQQATASISFANRDVDAGENDATANVDAVTAERIKARVDSDQPHKVTIQKDGVVAIDF